MTTYKDIAKNFIAPYVKRGDRYESIRDMGGSTSVKGVWVTVGGYSCGKKFSNDFIVVARFDEDKPLGVFKKLDLINEIKGIVPEQVALL